MRNRFVTSIVTAVVLALAAFAGTSLAGNGHGNGGGRDQQGSSVQPTQPTQQSSHGNAGKQSDTSPSNPATGGDNSHGVKPSNTTKHDTYATASSDQTKQYGNGKTAGQIATQAGQPNATLHGPGNSQPHKTSCGSHEVDVHALKSHGSKCGTATTQHPVKPAAKSKAQPVTPAAAPVTPAPAQAHVTICHATGSAMNPYVRISPSVSGVYHGHLAHQDGRDIVPPFTYNGQTYSENWDSAHQAIYNAGCATATAAATAAAPSQTPAAPALAAPAPATAAPSPAPAAATTTLPTITLPAATATPAGAVKGATFALKPKTSLKAAAATTKPKSHGGVLGTTTHLGNTITSTRLPFTGLPLWIFAALAGGLILLGAAVRRSAGGRV